MSPSPLLYTGLGLDRAHRLRLGADLQDLAHRVQSRFTLYWRGRQLAQPGLSAIAWQTGPRVREMIRALDAPVVFLGLDGDSPLLAADISALDGGDDGPAMDGGQWVQLRAVGGRLPAEDAALLAYARGVLVWRERTRRCSVCGGVLAVADGGHSTRCLTEGCGTLHFPRTDPAIIMLVTDPADRVLLGRQAAWPPGMYSCLAGFVEPGESLEEAVAREVLEEAGVRIRSARYFASQPWPFPSSLMIGFMAEAESGAEPVPDLSEIEDVRWFDRAEIARFGEADSPGDNGCFLPRPDAIARKLVEAWLKA